MLLLQDMWWSFNKTPNMSLSNAFQEIGPQSPSFWKLACRISIAVHFAQSLHSMLFNWDMIERALVCCTTDNVKKNCHGCREGTGIGSAVSAIIFSFPLQAVLPLKQPMSRANVKV